MPLARTYDAALGRVVTTARDAFLDRLSRWSDIQEYLPFLFETAVSYPEVQVLELGVRKGNSTLAFLAAAETVGGHVTSVDTDRVTDAADGMGPWRHCPGWTFIHGDDMDPAVQSLLPARCDVLFIDTSHEYGHTLAELRAYMPRVAPGGIALFHDTTVRGTWDKGNPVPSVARALDAYCEETGRTWRNLPGAFGLGVIEQPLEPGEGGTARGRAEISVLIPSRGRAADLVSSAETLLQLAKDISAVEILVAADPDDQDTIDAAGKIGAVLHVAPQRYGYQGLHHYYNYLAAVASGEWLMLWNDDCRMATRHWDEIIRRNPPGILHPDINLTPQHNSFPVVPREWAALLGYISPVYGVDLWWHALGMMTGTMRRVPVKIRHARINDDPVAAERDARDLPGELDVFNSVPAQVARWNDAQKIQAHLGKPPLVAEDTDVVVFLLQPEKGIEKMWQAEEPAGTLQGACECDT